MGQTFRRILTALYKTPEKSWKIHIYKDKSHPLYRSESNYGITPIWAYLFMGPEPDITQAP
jgi:hypothetical protein